MLKTTLLLCLVLLACSVPVEDTEERQECHFRGVIHPVQARWCDPQRCGFCRCLDRNVVWCDNTVSGRS